MSMGKRFLFFLVPSLAATPAFAGSEPETRPLEVTLHGAYSFGYVDGFMQTPLGGVPGTSNGRRPTLGELGIHNGGFYDAGLAARWHQLGFYGGYQGIGLEGNGHLPSPLVSHGVSFGEGDSFQTKDRFDWFRLGGGWNFQLAGGRLELFPKADLAVLDFRYKLASPSQDASRSYVKAGFRLGLEGSWSFTRNLSLKLDGAASVPIANTPQIATLGATMNWRLFPSAHAVRPTLFFGAGAEWIDYEDSQTLPNHVRLRLGPLLTGGLSLAF